MKKCLMLGIILFSITASYAEKNVEKYGVKGDGKTDATAIVQSLLDSGATEVYFPDGIYLLGNLKVSGDTTIRFAPKAKYKINPVKLPREPASPKDKGLIILKGNNITLDGLNFDFAGPDGKELGNRDVKTLIYGEGVNNLRILNLRALKTSFDGKIEPPDAHAAMGHPSGERIKVIQLEKCKDIEIANCNVSYIGVLVTAVFCENLSVHENRAEWIRQITQFTNSRGLRHYANWSRNVVFQCVWWGGDANDYHKNVPNGTANVVHRDLKPGDKGYHKQTAGVYDINVQNNYAEYGVTLAWGAKARNVIINGNIARFMDDLAYDSEGDENVIISDNISVNSRVAGIGCYFWTDKMLITDNVIMTLDEGDDRYKGDFIRLHCPGEDPDRFGNGKSLISGNLFVSELKDKLTGLNIEACRELTISGNKFVNGRITTMNNSRSVTIMNNDFVCDILGNYSCIKISNGGVYRDLIRGNSFRRTGLEKNPKVTQAAISTVGDNFNYPVLHHIESNSIDGWEYSISCASLAKNKKPRFIVRSNTVSGKISLIGNPESYRKFVKDNLNMNSLEIVEEKNVFVKQNAK